MLPLDMPQTRERQLYYDWHDGGYYENIPARSMEVRQSNAVSTSIAAEWSSGVEMTARGFPYHHENATVALFHSPQIWFRTPILSSLYALSSYSLGYLYRPTQSRSVSDGYSVNVLYHASCLG